MIVLTGVTEDELLKQVNKIVVYPLFSFKNGLIYFVKLLYKICGMRIHQIYLHCYKQILNILATTSKWNTGKSW